MRIVAILCVRNEQVYITSALEAFLADGIDVILIDHDSTDDTRSLAQGGACQ
jgi:glycosyltransferase involved in cell wall biosynthesis